MDRYTAGHRRGVACAPHFAAAEAGRAVLAEGGNALEAMVAMAAMIAVVYSHMNHLGGDGFWVVHEPSGKVRALMAAGAAGARATLAHYHEAGHHRVPTRGPFAAAACRSPSCSLQPPNRRAMASRFRAISRSPSRMPAANSRTCRDLQRRS